MRGKAAVQLALPPEVGITPAYAGKSVAMRQKYAICWDHPRVCGEKSLPSCPTTDLIGSPPRMRGKVLFGVHRGIGIGITPAYAGKRASCKIVHNKTPDHPRVCGEKWDMADDLCLAKGSPPRMRGKDDQLHEGSKQFRITPAYARKNCKFSTSLVNNWDHPRICGEKVWMLSAVA